MISFCLLHRNSTALPPVTAMHIRIKAKWEKNNSEHGVTIHLIFFFLLYFRTFFSDCVSDNRYIPIPNTDSLADFQNVHVYAKVLSNVSFCLHFQYKLLVMSFFYSPLPIYLLMKFRLIYIFPFLHFCLYSDLYALAQH